MRVVRLIHILDMKLMVLADGLDMRWRRYKAEEESKVILKFVAWITEWMAVSFKEMGETSRGQEISCFGGGKVWDKC